MSQQPAMPGGQGGPASGAGRTGRRRGLGWWLLLIIMFGTPILEIWVLIQVGQRIGAGWTIGLLLAAAVLGVWVIKRAGVRAWRSVSAAVNQGEMPGKSIADGALVLLGGALLVAPGLMTDVVGLILIVPVTRALVRLLLVRTMGRRLTVMSAAAAAAGNPFTTHDRPGASRQGPVVQGDVIDEE